eukprot:TRINITY_DN3000_c0_g1_i1.p1 TRINITY_DN3000_c0_g1~~TRINITY_DN3000_c0_g1_i1.p1  ORF type:complete len:316 (+),score=103.63 TRINITY_DN3000_c0_g1_i1:50-949(+)
MEAKRRRVESRSPAFFPAPTPVQPPGDETPASVLRERSGDRPEISPKRLDFDSPTQPPDADPLTESSAASRAPSVATESCDTDFGGVVEEGLLSAPDVRVTHCITELRSVCGTGFALSDGSMAVLFKDHSAMVYSADRTAATYVSAESLRAEFPLRKDAQVPDRLIPKFTCCRYFDSVFRSLNPGCRRDPRVSSVPAFRCRRGELAEESDGRGPVYVSGVVYADDSSPFRIQLTATSTPYPSGVYEPSPSKEDVDRFCGLQWEGEETVGEGQRTLRSVGEGTLEASRMEQFDVFSDTPL